MLSSKGGLRHYFEQELRYLREEAATFAQDYPAVAQELALSRGKSSDPHVELLMQSFAYLVGRLQHQIDEEEATIPNALLDQLYPHLAAPTPSMAIAQVDVKSEGANFANGWTLVRGRQMFATAVSENGRRVQCRFRNSYDTPLWPLRIRDAGLVPTNHYDFLSGRRDVYSVLRVRIESMSTESIQDLPLKSLRFYLHGDDAEPYRLYDMLSSHLAGMAVVVPGDSNPRMLSADALRWVGYGDDEAVLPEHDATAPSYRLLQEYFSFSEKFLFCDVQGINASGATSEFDLLFLLDIDDKSLRVTKGALRLNCVPIINLYSQPIEPLRLDQYEHEYRLIADQTAHSYSEIYGLEEIVAVKPDESPRTIAPYFALEDYNHVEARDYFYTTRRAESQVKSVPGTELYISFLDPKLDLATPAQETVTGRALCTNRRLAEQLRIGDRLYLEGAGPVNAVHLLSKPTPHRTPQLTGGRPWALVSQLSLNYLSLTGRAGGLEALKNMLRMHAGDVSPRNTKQIDSLIGLASRPVVRHLGGEQWRGFCRGIGITLLFDEERFSGGSLLLYAEILRRFFALYANLNSFTQLTIESQQRKGEIKTWLPLAGTQIVL